MYIIRVEDADDITPVFDDPGEALYQAHQASILHRYKEVRLVWTTHPLETWNDYLVATVKAEFDFDPLGALAS